MDENTSISGKRKTRISLPFAIIIAGVLIAAAIIYINYSTPKDAGDIGKDAISKQVLLFFDNNVLSGKAKAELSSITEESGVYKITIKAQGKDAVVYTTKNGKIIFPNGDELSKINYPTIGSFSVTPDEICTDNGKPVVYFFGSEKCPFCKWEQPIFERVMAKFGDKITIRKVIDKADYLDVLSKVDTGMNIPAIIFGCKYFRIGSGEKIGEAQDEKTLTALACKLTNSENKEVCDPVKDLIDQINN